jgi:hypothetical protein
MSPASYQTAPPRLGSVSAGWSTGQHRMRKMRAGVWKRRSEAGPHLVANSYSKLDLAGENSDVAVAMFFSELDYFFLERGRSGFRVGEHQLLGDGVVDSVGFDIKVVVITDDKCHFSESTSNEQSYKICSPD